MSDLYDRMAREGQLLRTMPWNLLTRAQKDQARSDEKVYILNGVNNVHLVAIPEDLLPSDPEVVEAQVEDETPVIPVNQPVIPEDLDVLTVVQLKELADTEQIDISGLKVKADILGRIWAIREERQEENN